MLPLMLVVSLRLESLYPRRLQRRHILNLGTLLFNALTLADLAASYFDCMKAVVTGTTQEGVALGSAWLML
jgi:hypothetical protein